METKKEMLNKVKNDFTKMLNGKECEHIAFHRYDGTKICIGNQSAKYEIIKYAIQLLDEELKRNIK